VPAAPTSEKVTYAADAFFDFDKATLKPAAKAKLDDLVQDLRHQPGSHHRRRSHRLVGSDAYNQKLSVAR
jgi:OOP family OmpA-OmpF porin